MNEGSYPEQGKRDWYSIDQSLIGVVLDGDIVTVREFLEHELGAVRELHNKKPEAMLEQVIKYLEKRLDGTIG